MEEAIFRQQRKKLPCGSFLTQIYSNLLKTTKYGSIQILEKAWQDVRSLSLNLKQIQWNQTNILVVFISIDLRIVGTTQALFLK